MKRHPRIIAFFLTILALTAGVFFLLNFPVSARDASPQFGVTFTPGQAESLGLDWRAAYAAILDDLGVRRFRLVAYWNDIQPIRETFDFAKIDEQMDELAKRGGTATLAIGRKVPRWPECHDPSWIASESREQIETDVTRYISAVVEHFRNHPALGRWQVENEVLFPFGKCPNMLSFDALKREVAQVRLLDPHHEIMVTESGEWASWLRFVGTGDVLGVSMYRGAWNNHLGYIPFPVGPGWYQLRASLLKQRGMNVVISELQAEPWGKKSVQEMSVAEGIQLFSPEKLQENIAFARRIGFDEITLWGVEWWYWLSQHGDARMWEQAKELFIPNLYDR